MGSYLQHYIGGQWIDSEGGTSHDVVNPATEEVVSTVTFVDPPVAKSEPVRRFARFGFGIPSVTRAFSMLVTKTLPPRFRDRKMGEIERITE